MDIIRVLRQKVVQSADNGSVARDVSDPNAFDLQFVVGGDVHVRAWEANDEETGERSLAYAVARLQGDKRQGPLRFADLIANVAGLAILADEFSRHEAVEEWLQEELLQLAIGMAALLLPTIARTASDAANKPFGPRPAGT